MKLRFIKWLQELFRPEFKLNRFSKLEKDLGYNFKNQNFLTQALSHPSYIAENKKATLPSNQRLEFLGDSVLNLVVCEYLYQAFPKKNEGSLTRKKARLVRDSTLAKIAQHINLGDYIQFGTGEERTHGRERISNLAAAFEAVIGAIYLDSDLANVHHVLEHLLFSDLNKILEDEEEKNYKGRLQEFVQQFANIQPAYRVIDHSGPSHQSLFTVEVYFKSVYLGKGAAPSKKKAEQLAAKAALELLERDNSMIASIQG